MAASAPGRIRTCDQVLRRHLLYPLSYGRRQCPLRGGRSWKRDIADVVIVRGSDRSLLVRGAGFGVMSVPEPAAMRACSL